MPKKTVSGAIDLRDHLAQRPQLRLEFLAKVSELLRSHNIPIEDSALSKLTIASDDEVQPSRQMIVMDPI